MAKNGLKQCLYLNLSMKSKLSKKKAQNKHSIENLSQTFGQYQLFLNKHEFTIKKMSLTSKN